MSRALAAAAALLAACTFSDGDPYARLAASFDARLATPADRDAGEGWQKLASDYQVRVATMTLELAGIELVDTGDTSTSGFDPAHPPPGYSLCHNGHCHADDGRLVPYDEIAAELAGGKGLTTVVVLPVGELDLIAGRSGALACEPGCDLPRAHIGLARAGLVRLRVSGSVRDGRSPPRLDGEHAFTLDLPFPEGSLLRGELDLPADRTHDPDVALALTLAASVGVLDGVDWQAQAQSSAGAIDLGGSDAAATTARTDIRERTLELELGAAVHRQETRP